MNKIYFLILALATQNLHAADIVGGIKTFSTLVERIGIALTVISFTGAGIIYLLNKQHGAERFSGALTGTVLIASASGLSTLIYQMFK